MEIKRAKVDNKLLDVVSLESFNRELHGNQSVAVEATIRGNRYILPIRGNGDDRPGVYDMGPVSFLKLPEDCSDEEINEEDYLYDNIPVYDFGSAKSIEDVITTQAQIRGMEADLLTDIDSTYRCIRNQHDSPEMKALKDAIDLKECDLNKYANRYGENFLNDKRILKGENITLKKMCTHAENLDMEIELIIRDRSSDVPNPMGSEVRAILTGKRDDDTDE